MASLTQAATQVPNPIAEQTEIIAAAGTADLQPADRRELPEVHPAELREAKLVPVSLKFLPESPRFPSQGAVARMTAALLAPGTMVELKVCRHCIEQWITARREYEDRGLRRDPAVQCSHEHLRGVVQLYDMQYSRGAFPVLFSDGIWRQEMTVDLWVIAPETVEDLVATVVTLNPRARQGASHRRRDAPARTA